MAVVSSESFYHFTSGGLDVLKLILQNGFQLSLCDDITDFINSVTQQGLVTALSVPMICFAIYLVR